MILATGRYLGQMRDCQDLILLAQLPHERANCGGNCPANARIDFVEDQGFGC